jgi:hypothetical protein
MLRLGGTRRHNISEVNESTPMTVNGMMEDDDEPPPSFAKGTMKQELERRMQNRHKKKPGPMPSVSQVIPIQPHDLMNAEIVRY